MPSPLSDVGGKPRESKRDGQDTRGRQNLQEETSALDSNREVQVHIVGPLKLQNELMRGFLERETGLTCVCCEDLGLTGLDIKTDKSSVVLWDCLDTNSADLWGKFHVGSNSRCFHALFNVRPDQGICQEAVNHGVRGIFFEGDPPSIFHKGIKAILNKELWFSRETLAKCLLDERSSSGLPQRPQTDLLTPREKEILIMITSGASNGKIANDLCISPNTVKTHIYNIYNKINVPNRLQAALWASKNL